MVRGAAYVLITNLGAIACASGVGLGICVALSVMFNAIAGAFTEAAIAQLDGKSQSQVRQALVRGLIKGGAGGFVAGFMRYYGVVGRIVSAARKKMGW